MYLSLIKPQKSAEAGFVGDLATCHHQVWSFFPHDPDASRAFLFRFEDDPQSGPTFWIQSDRPPRTKIPNWQAETTEYMPRPEQGDVFHFSLRANPVACRDGRFYDRIRNRLEVANTPLQTIIDEEAKAWLAARAEHAGFQAFDPLIAWNYQVHRFEKRKPRHKRAKGRGQKIALSTLDIEGHLRVTCPKAFRTSLLKGLGRARSYGCGMLLCAPPKLERHENQP